MTSRPFTGGATGRCRATGSPRATSPSRAIEASSVAVNVFVIEPISNVGGRVPAPPQAALAAGGHADHQPGVARGTALQDGFDALLEAHALEASRPGPCCDSRPSSSARTRARGPARTSADSQRRPRDAIDAVARGLDRHVPASATHITPLLGADGFQALWNRRERVAASSGLPVARIEHLLRRFGARIDELLALVAERPALGEPLPGADDSPGGRGRPCRLARGRAAPRRRADAAHADLDRDQGSRPGGRDAGGGADVRSAGAGTRSRPPPRSRSSASGWRPSGAPQEQPDDRSADLERTAARDVLARRVGAGRGFPRLTKALRHVRRVMIRPLLGALACWPSPRRRLPRTDAQIFATDNTAVITDPADPRLKDDLRLRPPGRAHHRRRRRRAARLGTARRRFFDGTATTFERSRAFDVDRVSDDELHTIADTIRARFAQQSVLTFDRLPAGATTSTACCWTSRA